MAVDGTPVLTSIKGQKQNETTVYLPTIGDAVDSLQHSKATANEASQNSSAEHNTTKQGESPCQRNLRYATQVLMFIMVTQGHLNLGMGLSWPNTLASDILVDNSTLFGTEIAFADWEMDMIGSLLFFSTGFAFLASGWLVAKLGRRRPMMLAGIPCVLGWAFAALATNQHLVLVGRFFLGLAYGVLGVSVRTYLVEVADTGVRGAVSTLAEVMKGIGAIAIIGIGTFLPWYFLAFMCGVQMLLYCCLIVPFMPESPAYLAVMGKEEEARQVLRRLRGPDADIGEEIQILKKANQRSVNTSCWTVVSSPFVFKRILIVAGLFFISNFSGSEVIRANATRMLQTSGLAMDRDTSTIVVFVVLLLGNVTAFLMLDRLGRRRNLVLSLTLVAISYAVMGAYVFLFDAEAEVSIVSLDAAVNGTNAAIDGYETMGTTNDLSWIPLVCLMLAAFSSNFGISPIPWILSVEYFPTSIRSQVMGVCTMLGNFLSFISLQTYSSMQDAFTQAGLYWTYTGVAVFGIIYTCCCVQETKGVRVG